MLKSTRCVLLTSVFCLFAFAGFSPVSAGTIVIQALFKDMAVVNMDSTRITLKKGKPVGGLTLISADSHEAIIEYHGKRSKYTLGGQPIRSDYAEVAVSEPVSVWPDDRGLYTTAGTVNGIAAEFMIDTGASVVAMNAEHARRFGIDYRNQGRDINVETASGKLIGSSVSLNSIKVGHITVRNVIAVVLPGEQPRRVLLGASFLNNVEMQRKDAVIELRARPY